MDAHPTIVAQLILSPRSSKLRFTQSPCRYDGKLGDLNRQLVAAGLNIVVIRQEPDSDMLSPGDPVYDN